LLRTLKGGAFRGREGDKKGSKPFVSDGIMTKIIGAKRTCGVKFGSRVGGWFP